MQESLDRRDIHTIAFSDYQAVIIEGESRRDLTSKGHLTIDSITRWSYQVKLSHGPQKCTMLLLKGNLHKKCPPHIFIKTVRIKRVKSTKYLGIKLATGSRVKKHVDDMSSKASTIFDHIARVARYDCGIERASNGVFVGSTQQLEFHPPSK